MLVAFWTIAHGQTANTVNTAAITSMLALENNLKMLLFHSQFSRSILENCFISKKILEQDKTGAFSDRGIDALTRLAKNKKLTPKSIQDYTITLLKGNRLDLLIGTENENETLFENTLEGLKTIIDCSSEAYDVICMDVHSGLNKKMSKVVLEWADFIVVNLNQNMFLLEDFFEDEEIGTFLRDKKYLVNISRYDKRSKYTLKNIARRFKINHIAAVPYHVPFMDACNSSQLIEYIVRHGMSHRKDEHTEFINHLRKTTQKILELSGFKEG